MDQSQPVARPWALLALASIWSSPLVVRLFVRYPMWSVLPVVAWCLAVIIAVSWLVPAFRRATYVPDAAARGGAVQVFGAAMGMGLVGFASRYVLPALDSE